MASIPDTDERITFDVPNPAGGGMGNPHDNIPAIPKPEPSGGVMGAIRDAASGAYEAAGRAAETVGNVASGVYDAMVPSWEELEAVARHPLEAVIGAGKDVLGTPWDMAEIGAAAHDILGPDVVNQLPMDVRLALKLSKKMQGTKPSMLELTNDAQKGGAKIAVLVALLKGLAKLLAKGFKVSKSVANAVEEAADDIAKKADLAKKKKADQLKKNKKQGKLREQQVAKELEAEGHEVLGSEVTIKTPETNRRVDHLIRDGKTGEIRAIEVKSGGARRSSSQISKDNAMAAEGGKIIGKNAPPGLEGQTIRIPTEVRN